MIQALHTIYGRKYAVQNTFIGGVGATINTPALLATRLGILESRITLFEVVGSEVRCNISGSYTMPSGAFNNNTELTYFNDVMGMCIGLNGQSLLSLDSNLEYIYFPNLLFWNGTPSNWSILLPHPKLKSVYIPKCVNFGSTQGFNSDFIRISGLPFVATAKWYVNPSMATSNAGGVEGDLAWLSANGNTLRYVSNFSAPNQITTLTSGTIYNTAIQLNFTPPSSTNAIDYYECYANGIYKGNIKNSGDYISGLTPSTTYTIEIIAVDIFLNKSVKSNVLSVSTNTIPFSFMSNLFASYRFENNANDYLEAHNATPTALTYASGKVGQGAVFNGTGSFAIIPDNNVFSFTDGTNDKPFSISMCLKFSATTECEILDKLQNLTDGLEYQMAFKDSIINMYLYSESKIGNSLRFNAPFAPTVGVWYFITFTHIGGVGKWYVNGSLVTTSKIITGTYVKMINTNSSLIIGKRGFTYGGFFNGSIDELNFYNKALSQSEITEINSIINSGNHIS